ncbi:MAG TPA: DUF5018 domain-containing protein [Bacteroides sp.]|nr:DUF5018 domain-containing protein [Bacteroides sp.]
MKKAGSTVLIVVCLSLFAHAQNLVQNPGFEAITAWDSLWMLSYTNPSTPTAVALQNTAVYHGGSGSLELRNSKQNMWTYMYSDTILAPIRFSANKSYEVSGWMRVLEQGKGASLSIFWNGSQNEKTLYAGNPDPITNPDWFMLKDTITPDSDFGDGYLRMGMRAGRSSIGDASGRLLFDDLSVTRIPDLNETAILDFTFREQTGPAVINRLTGTITVEVEEGTDLTALAPDRIVLSRGATVNPETGVPTDFTEPVAYTVTAQDEMTKQQWIVTVNLPPSSATDILAFSCPEQTGPAVIDTTKHVVLLEVAYGTDLSSLVPDIEISEGAIIEPADSKADGFTSPVVYRVIAEDGTTLQEWTVYVSVAEPSAETGITAFSFEGQDGEAIIDTVTHTVTIEVPYGTAVDALIPVIGISPGASVDPAGGVATDFTGPVVFIVTAEDGATMQEWTVSVAVLPNTEADITEFSFQGQDWVASIDTTSHSVTFEVIYGTAVDALIPVIGVSPGASVDPPGGVATDFTDPRIFTVIADDGVTTQEWTVSVVVLPNTETEILSFAFEEQTGPAAINNETASISIEVENQADITSLVPFIEVSPGAAVDPPGGVTADFSADVVYTVTAEDGVTTQDWTVTVAVDPAVTIPQEQSAPLFSVYPNPARELLIVDLFVQGDLFISDVMGRTVRSLDHASGRTVIPLDGLAQGTYFIRMVHPEGEQIRRFMIR